jgi:hypothetical protein
VLIFGEVAQMATQPQSPAAWLLPALAPERLQFADVI